MKAYLLILILFIPYSIAYADEKFKWPKGETSAISLSYDDSLDSQLDNALPALNKYQLRASFYVVSSARSMQQRLEEWREVPIHGHELGNHTVYHSCRGSLPNRGWVDSDNDLDKRSPEELKKEVILANTFLQALDGKAKRTFTVPCGDTLAGGKDYLTEIKDLFVAIKGQETSKKFANIWIPYNVTGRELISHIKRSAKEHKLINIIFHGVGGDHLPVSTAAHEQLLKYLSENRDIYWVDSYINIMEYVNKHRES